MTTTHDPALDRAVRAMDVARSAGASAVEVALAGISAGFDERALAEDMERRREREERARIERMRATLNEGR